jgi:bacillithiol biosynthesis deacetylase BshB1
MAETLDLLIFGAHPDDAEIGMGGTIAKHTKAGYRVGICDLTRAEMSSNGDVQTRAIEAERASEILGLASRSNLSLPDRGLSFHKEQIDMITAEIRKYRPRIVFAPYWEDRHPDHVMCSRLVEEAVFNAKLRKYLPDLQPAAVEQLYFYFINDIHQSDVLVDISSVYEMKRQSLLAYRSQFAEQLEGMDIVKTPLNQGYLQRVEARDILLGQVKSYAYAEGFVCKQPVEIKLF